MPNTGNVRRTFVERTLRKLAETMEHAGRAEASATGTGFLQRIDPRAKLGGLLLLIVAAVASHRIAVTGAIFATALLLAAVSGKTVLRTIAALWGGILFFTGAIVFPSLFTTPGATLWIVPWLHWKATATGLHSAVHLIVRAETTATLATLMVLTTPWPHLLKALRVLRVPAIVVAILSMTHRYIFLMLQLAQDYFEARRVRMVGNLDDTQRRRMAVSGVAVLLSKSLQLASEVYEAMLARGFRGTVYTLDEFRMKTLDWWTLAGFVLLATIAFRCASMNHGFHG